MKILFEQEHPSLPEPEQQLVLPYYPSSIPLLLRNHLQSSELGWNLSFLLVLVGSVDPDHDHDHGDHSSFVVQVHLVLVEDLVLDPEASLPEVRQVVHLQPLE
jgi:hypothetical protein